MIEVLIWIIGAVFLILYSLLIYGLWFLPKNKPEPKPCPHGYADWDECPVCCH